MYEHFEICIVWNKKKKFIFYCLKKTWMLRERIIYWLNDMIHVSIHALLIDSDTYTDSKKQQHHSINDRLSNNQICIMFENSKNLIDQTSLISWSKQQKVNVHAITMLIQCCLISHPWYKPASLLYTIVLHECISVTDLKSAWGGGGHKYMYMGGSGQRRSCIYMHACYKDLHFFDNIIWGDTPFPTF